MIKQRNILAENLRRFNTKNLQEQSGNKKPVESIDLPNGKYIGDGAGYQYGILDLNGTDTGYSVKSERGIRGFIQDDPVQIVNGVAYSETWGEGGEYFYEEKGYKPAESETIINNVAKEGVKLNTILIETEDYPLTIGSKSKFTCNYKGKSYVWDITGIYEFSNTVRGDLQCQVNNYQLDDSINAMQYLQLDDANPNGYFVGIYNNGTFYIVYDSMSGAKYKEVSP